MPKKHGEAIDPTDITLSDAADVGYQPEQRIIPAASSIRILNDGSMTIGGFTMTRTGLQIQPGVQVKDWNKIGSIIADLGKSIQWILGDWLAFGIEREYGVTYEQVAQTTDYEIQSLRDLVYVCTNVQLSVRTDKLSFGHHKLVAALAPHEQVELLQKAALGKWSISQMREAIKENPPAPPLELSGNEKFDKAYGTILSVFRHAKPEEKMRLLFYVENLAEEMRKSLR